MTETYTGKTVVIGRPSYELYNAFSNLDNLSAALTSSLPQDKREMVRIEGDTILVKVQGFELGLQVNNRTPFSRIDFSQYGQAPFPFLFSMFTEPASDSTTFFHLELRAELNMMFKMMLGKKLQEVIDKITDQIVQAASGQMPENFDQYMQQMQDVSR